eukprot:gene8847-1207_t
MKRKKGSRHSKGFRKQRENKKSSGGDLLGAEEDGLFVLGYACNFHRNTELYNTTESGSLLQTWHDDSTLLLDSRVNLQAYDTFVGQQRIFYCPSSSSLFVPACPLQHGSHPMLDAYNELDEQQLFYMLF